ncbi:MAG: type I 3-dehydroquinate dehydratase, partial [Nitrososphaerales archaeon]
SVICSHHDLDATPSADKIIRLFNQMKRKHSDIVKLVFTPKDGNDILSILKAAEEIGKAEVPFTLFGMGQEGKITRLVSPNFGGSLVYCSLEKNPDATLGQIDLGRAKKYFEYPRV